MSETTLTERVTEFVNRWGPYSGSAKVFRGQVEALVAAAKVEGALAGLQWAEYAMPGHACDSAAEACAVCEWQQKMDKSDPAAIAAGGA